MAINNLATLQAAIIDWVARTDLSIAVINNFIDLAENEIINGVYDETGRVIVPPLRVKAMEFRDPTFFLSGEYTDLPARFLGFRAVRFNANPDHKLEYVTPAVYDSKYVGQDTSALVYTIESGQLRVGPSASASDTLDVIYYQYPDVLTVANTNWLITTYPNVYLYGALRHLAIYCGMDSRLGFFQSSFLSTLAGLHAAQKSIAYSGVTLFHQTIGVTVS